MDAAGPKATSRPGGAPPDTVKSKPAAILPPASFASKTTIRAAVMAVGAVGVIAAATFVVSSRGAQPGGPVSAGPSATARADQAVRSTSAAIEQASPATPPKWSRTRQSSWATDGSRTIGFELEAERDVPVYLDRVRPLLAVRCISHRTQVFVVLNSSASIESASDTHTVKVSLDGEPAAEEQWLDSSDKQALFSPDGEALAARLAGARSLHFHFRPFNAPPATVEFDVHGFDGPLAAMAKTCGVRSKGRPTAD